MDFATSLRQVLEEGGNDFTDSKPGMLKWNGQVESFLASPPTTSSSSVEEEYKSEDIKGDILHVSKRLQNLILKAIGSNASNDSSDDEVRSLTARCHDRDCDELDLGQLSETLRAVKNLLRWYLQIYCERMGVVLPSPVRSLESDCMLDLYVLLLERFCACDNIVISANDHVDGVSSSGFGRTISLLIFYATYSLLPGDETKQESLRHLVQTRKFPELVLRILQRGPSFVSAALALSLIRNIHNLLVSLQGANRIISIASIPLTRDAGSDDTIQPWWTNTMKAVDDATDATLTYRSILVDVAQWAIHDDKDMPFPGDGEDKRSELVNEILSTFYALRIGTELKHTSNIGLDESGGISKLVVDLLKMKFASGSDSRAFRCQLLAVTLIMDAHPSFASKLIDTGAVVPILDILETQVTNVVEQTRVDPSGLADLVPVLVVLNKFASSGVATDASTVSTNSFQKQVKDRIFPPDAEQQYLDKVLAQQQEGGGKKNMAPLDAPKGTLRWKLMRLMTWPESHVKRCTNELLWTVCSSDANEFVSRVGLGNAMPMLNLKGYVDLPK